LGAASLRPPDERPFEHVGDQPVPSPSAAGTPSLAEELGPEACAWLFDGATAAWAFVTARIRNTLAHGLAAPDGVHEDVGALSGALRLTEAVITLRLLTEAGLPSDDALVKRLVTHRGMRALALQTIANWPALAHRIAPQQWPDPMAPKLG
jgi:hypothetical protein